MTISNWLRLSGFIFVAVIVQVAVLDQLVVLGAHPDVLVLLPVAAALLAGPERGAIVGFVAGLGADLFVNLPYGLSPLSFVLAGFGIGMIAAIPGAVPRGSGLGVICAVGGGFVTLLYALIAALIGQKDMLGRDLIDALIVVTAAAFVLAPVVLWSLRWCFRGTGRSAFGLSVPAGGSATT